MLSRETRQSGKYIGALLVILAIACGTQKKDSSSVGGSSTPASEPGSGDPKADDGDVTKVGTTSGSMDSVKAFELTLFPLVRNYCAGECHGVITNPKFAQPDAKAAHDVLLASGKIDFADPESSRIYERMALDSHNCSTNCTKWGDEFKAAIVKWINLRNSGSDAPKNQTPQLGLSELVNYAAPTDPMTFVFEAESGTLTAATTVSIDGTTLTPPVQGASGRFVAGTGATSIAQSNPASAAAPLVAFSVAVTQPGKYNAWARINTTSDKADEMVFNFFQGTAPAATAQKIMRLPTTGVGKWAWVMMQSGYTKAAANAAEVPVAGVFDVTAAGAFTLQAKPVERVAAAGAVPAVDVYIDKVAISANPAFRGDDAIKLLKFDLSAVSKKPGTYLEVEFDPNFSDKAYMIRNPRIICTQPIHLAGMKVLLNGNPRPGNSGFVDVDQTIAAPGAYLSYSSITLLKKDAATDKISFSFEVME